MTEEAAVVCTRFHAGDKIPSWLLDIEPNNPQAVKGVLRFGTEVDVIETPNSFSVLPTAYGDIPPIVQFEGGAGCNLFASAKPVRVPLAMMTLITPDQNAWHPQDQSPGVAFLPPRTYPPSVPGATFNARVIPTLWKRIKAVFRP